MPANKTHLTSILQSFSTYLEMRQVSDEVAEDAVLFFVEYLRKKPSLTSWKPEDVVTFATKSKKNLHGQKQAVALVTQFVENFPPHQANVLLHQYLLALKHDGCSEATIRNYRSDIRQFMAFHNATDLTEIITKPKVLEFLHHEKDKHLKFSSIKRKLVSIIQIAEWAERENLPVKSTRELNQVASDLEKLLSSHKKPSRVHSRPKNTIKHWSMPLKHASGTKVQSILQSPFKPHSGSQANQDYRARLQAGMSELAKKVQDKTTGKLLPWLNLTMILLFFLGGSFLAYQQFFTKIDSPLAFPTAPVRPNRVLSFQGRLTDTAQNPVVAATDFRFRLFDSGPGTGAGTQLWDSGTCSVDPDQDGIFATGLGDALAGCGAEIGADVFTENSNVWLQVEVETEVLDPRQQIKTVAYALNAETVQGIPVSATEAATVNTLILMNESGEVVLGEVSPTLRSESGTFSIEAQGLLLKTASGSNGDITLSPDGTGGVRVESDLTSTGYFSAPGATISATYAAGTALTLKAGPSATADIVQWQTSTGTALGIINSAGNIGVGTTSAPYPLTVNGAINGLIATAGSITTGTWNATAIGPTKGGTGIESYSTGDLIYASGADTLTTRSVGATNQVLTVVGGVPTWAAPGVAGSVAWNNITAPLGNLALNMSTYTTGMNWATGTGTNNLFSFTTDASANGTGSLVNIQTGTGSTVSPLRVRAGSTEALAVSSTGNVGVGTTVPGEKLTVAGNAYLNATNPSISWDGNWLNLATRTDVVPVVAVRGTTSYGGRLDIYDEGNDVVAVSIQGRANQNSYFNNGGNVGIGTTAPDSLLNIYSTTAAPVLNITRDQGIATGNDVGHIRFTAQGGIVSDISSIINGVNEDAAHLDFSTKTASGSITTRMRITDAGYVGIGTTVPTSRLTLGSSAGSSIEFPSVTAAITSNAYYASGWKRSAAGYATSMTNYTNDGSFQFSVSGTSTAGSAITWIDALKIANSGNVGINSTSPGFRLDVAGTGKFSGLLTTTGISNATTAINNSASYTQSGTNANTFTGTSTFSNATYSALFTGGNVGIGSTSPGYGLDVVSGDAIAAKFDGRVIGVDAVNTNELVTKSQLDAVSGALPAATEGYTLRGNGSSWQANSSLFIKSDGNVGIGTTAPGAKLEVIGNIYIGNSTDITDRQLTIYGSGTSGAANQYIKTEGVNAVWHSGYGKFTVEPAGDFIFKPWNGVDAAYVERMRLDTDTGALVIGRNYTAASGPTSGAIIEGNVGIGTTAPGAYKLNVAGSGYFTDLDTGQGAFELQNAGVGVKGLASFNTANFAASSGDITIKTGGVGATELASTAVAAGSYGSATQVATFTVDADGRLTAAGNTAITYPGGFSGFANPTASIGLTAVNGVATTAMRSDAAPALSQAIVPTWTGTHTFSNATYSALFTGGNVGIGTTVPGAKLEVYNDSAAGQTLQRIRGYSDNAGGSQVLTGLEIFVSGYQTANVFGSRIKIESENATPVANAYGLYIDAFAGAGTITNKWGIFQAGTNEKNYFAGNVGIGITPTALLHVNGDFKLASGTNVNNIATTVGATGDDNTLVTEQGIREALASLGSAVGLQEAYVNGNTVLLSAGEGDIRFYNDASQEMLFLDESSGYVGIGTTTPLYPLHVNSTTGIMVTNPGSSVNVGGYLSVGQYGSAADVALINANTVASGDLHLGANNSIDVTILNDGNVGIGTTAPGDKLEIYESLANPVRITINNPNASGKSTFAFKENTVFGGWIEYVNAANTLDIQNYTNGSFGAVSLNALGGNVGIGTTVPGSKLSIFSSTATSAAAPDAADYINVESLTGGFLNFRTGTSGSGGLLWSDSTRGMGQLTYSHTTNKMTFVAGGIIGMTLDNGGYVGIGTTSPGSMLDVYKADSSIPATIRIRSKDTAVGSPPFSTLEFRASTTSDVSTDYQVAKIVAGYDLGAYTTARLTIQSLDSAGNYIDTLTAKNGNVGIGTTSPGKLLHVGSIPAAGSPLRAGIRLQGGGNTAGNWANWDFEVGAAAVGDSAQQTELLRLSNNTVSDVMVWERSTGRVGIGTTVPTALLHVNGDFKLQTGTNVNNIATTVGATGDDNTLVTEQGIREALASLGSAVGLQEAYVNGNTVLLSAGEGDIRFYNDASQEMLFLDESSGYVGIGTTTPYAPLTVKTPSDPSTQEAMVLLNPNTAGGAGTRLTLAAWESAGAIFRRAAIDGVRSSIGAGGDDGDLQFWTNLNGTLYQRMTVLYDGNVGIGTTGPTNMLTVETASNGKGINFDSGGTVIGSLERVQIGSTVSMALEGASGRMVSINNNNSTNVLIANGGGNVGIGTTVPGAGLHIDKTFPLILDGGNYTESDLYVLNTNNLNTGVGFAAKVIGVNIQNAVGAGNQVYLRSNTGGLTSAGAIYLGSDNESSQGVFGVLGGSGAAGTELSHLLTVKGDGNVGIGTTAPGAKFDVTNLASWTATSIATSNNSNMAFKMILRASQNGAVTMGSMGSNTFGMQSYDNVANTANPIVINPFGGSVGIGTTVPGQKLHVSGGNAQFDKDYGLYWNNLGSGSGDSSQIYSTFTGGETQSLVLKTTNDVDDHIILLPSGNTGINITTPTAKLHVNGDFRLLTGTNVNNIATTVGATGDDNTLVTEQGIREALNVVSGSAGGWTDDGSVVRLTTSTDSVGIGTTSTDGKLTINDGGFNFKIKYIGTQGGSYRKSVILLHEAYNATLLSDNYAVGKIIASRGSTGAYNRKEIAEINTGSAYNGTNGNITSLSSDNIKWELITVTYGGTKYLAIEVPYTAANLERFTFEGYHKSTATEGLKIIDYYDVNISTVLNAEINSSRTVFTPVGKKYEDVAEFVISGSVGIGTTSPSSKFSVGATSQFQVNSSGYVGIAGASPSTTCGGQTCVLNVTGYSALGGLRINGADVSNTIYQASGDLGLSTGAGDIVLNATGGNVGIGTTAPSDLLALNVPTGSTKGITFMESGLSSYGARMSYNEVGDYLSINTIQNSVEMSGISIKRTDGSVGIGTTAPGAKLHVYGNSQGNYGVYDTPLRIQGDTYSYLELVGATNQAGVVYNRNGSTGWLSGLNTDGKFRIADLASIDQTGLTNAKDGTEGITIQLDGNVGIGTTVPGTNLHVSSTNGIIRTEGTGGQGGVQIVSSGTSNPFINFGTGGTVGNIGSIYGVGATTDLRFFVNGGDRMTILNDGKVGIGSTSPQAKLDVSAYDGTYDQISAVFRGGEAWGGGVNRIQMRSGSGTTVYSEFATVIGGAGAGADLRLRVADASNVLQDRLTIQKDGNVGIGSTSPGYGLDVVSGDAIAAKFDGRVIGGNAVNTNEFVTKSQLDAVGSALPAATTNGQTLRANGTSWVANSTLFNNGTNVGIGTTSPAYKLDLGSNNANNNEIGNARLAGAGRNLIRDGSFELTNSIYSGWSAGSAWGGSSFTKTYVSPTDTPDGDYVAQMSCTYTAGGCNYATSILQNGFSGNAGYIPVQPSTTYTACFTAKRISGTVASSNLMYMQEYNSAYAGVLNLGRYNGGNIATTWTRYCNSFTTQATTEYLIWGMYDYATGVAQFDEMSLTKGTVVASYTAAASDIPGNATSYGKVFFSDNVGIGTTVPNEKLEVAGGNIRVGGDIYVRGGDVVNNSADNSTLTLATGVTAGVQSKIILRDSWNGTNNANAYIAFNLGDGSNSLEKVRITNQGNVGIGTTAPSNKFTVKQADTANLADIAIKAENATGALAYLGSANPSYNSGALYLYQNASPNTLISANGSSYLMGGNVGIGTTNPGARLEVDLGDSKLRGALFFQNKTGGTANYSSFIANNADAAIYYSASGGTYPFDRNGNLVIQPRTSVDSDIAFAVGATTPSVAMMIDGTNSYVGIGTTAPGAKLHIVRTGNTGNQFRTIDTEGTTAAVRTYSTADGDGLIINQYYAVAGSPYLRNADFVASMSDAAATQMRFLTKNLSSNPAVAMLIDRTGNVGIGSTSPGYGLDVVSGDAIAAKFDGRVIGGNAVDINEFVTKSQLDAVGSALPAATTNGQTLRANGTSWVANSVLFNNGTNVGIGTTNPVLNLTVRTAGGDLSGSTVTYPTQTTGILLNMSTNSNNVGSGIWLDHGGLQAGISSARKNTGTWGTDLRFYVHPDATTNQFVMNEVMRINPDGNVGISTTAPGAKLHVQGAIQTGNGPSGGGKLTVYGTTGTIELRTTDNLNPTLNKWDMRIRDGGVEGLFSIYDAVNSQTRLAVTTAGNVGIGTTAPWQKLDVVGNVNLSGNYLTNRSAPLTLSALGPISIGEKIIKVNYGTAQNAAQAESYCSSTYGAGWHLYIPRSKQDLANAFRTAMSGADPSASYLYIMGIYPKWNGATCGSTALRSDNASCNWKAGDGGSFWVSDRTNTVEPNGDNNVTSSMNYIWDANGVNTTYNDIGSPGYTSAKFICQGPVSNTSSTLASDRGVLEVNGGFQTTTDSYLATQGGRVGIGTTNPVYSLDVVGNSNLTSSTNWTYLNGTEAMSSNGSFFYLANGGFAGGIYTQADLKMANGYSIYPYTNEGSSLGGPSNYFNNSYIKNGYFSGNVGIGSTSPGYKLDVSNGTGIVGQFSGRVIGGNAVNTNEFVTKSQLDAVGSALPAATTNGQTLRANGTSWVANSVLFNDGTNVGIGTTNPIGKLEVAGGAGTSKIFKEVGVSQPDYTYFYLKLFKKPSGTGWGATTFNGKVCATRSNDIGVTQCADIYASRSYDSTIYFSENVNSTGYGTFQPVVINDGGFDWVALLYDAHTGAGILSWTVDGTLYNSNAADVISLTQINSTSPIHSTLSYSARNTSIPYGNVGIGTTGPGAKLEVSGDILAQTQKLQGWYIGPNPHQLELNGYSGGWNAGLQFGATNTNNRGHFGFDVQGGDLYYSSSSDATNFSTKFTIKQDGNVGIGTTSPGAMLTVAPTGVGRQLMVQSWADISSSGSGYGLFGGNMYQDFSPTAFKYSNTHASIGAIGFATNYPSWNQASIISSGTTSSTAGSSFTPTSIATFNGTTGALSITGSLTTGGGATIGGSATITGDATISGGDLTISKESLISEITFPGGYNDAGYIRHSELTNNAGVMEFRVSDDNADNDYYSFFGGATETTRITAAGKAAFTGAIRTGSVSPTAYNHFGSGGTNNYAVDAADVYIQHDLEVDGTIYGNIAGTINPGFTTGSVIFQGASGLAQDNANFFWDDTNNKLGIGTTSPGAAISVYGGRIRMDGAATGQSAIEFTSAGTEKSVLYRPSNSADLRVFGSTFGGDIMTWNTTNGYVGIGTTVPGAKLDVAGNIRFGTTTASNQVYSVERQIWGSTNTGTTGPYYAKIYSTTTLSAARTLHFILRSQASSEYSAEVKIHIPQYSGFYYSSYGAANSGNGPQVEISTGGLTGQTNSLVSIVESNDDSINAPYTELWLKINPPHSGTDIFIQEFADNTEPTLLTIDNGSIAWTTTAPSNQLREYSFAPGAKNINNTLFVKRDSNVGIGTTSPGANLHVSSTNGIIRTEGTGGQGGVQIVSSGTSNPFINFGTGGTVGNIASIYGVGATTDLRFFVNGGDRMTILNNGNVGIGSTNPGAPLTLSGGIGLGTILTKNGIYLGTNDNYSATAYFGFQRSPVGYTNDFAITGSADATTQRYLHIGYNTSDAPGSAFNPKVSINTYSGNVGIGITAPNAPLQFATTVGDKIYLYQSGSIKYGLGVQNNDLQIFTGNAGDYISLNPNGVQTLVANNGNVGIGTTSPNSKLDIARNTRSATHPTSLSLYVTGDMADGKTGIATGNIEFRHSNATQGIGFGYNTIYQAGSNTNQDLNFLSKGSSPITLNAYGYSTGNVGIGTTVPGAKLEVEALANDGVMIGNFTEWGGNNHAGIKDDHGHLMLYTNPHLPNGYFYRYGGTNESTSYDIGISGNVFNIGTTTFGGTATNTIFGGNVFAEGGISTYDNTVADNTIETGTICLGNGTNCISDWGNGGNVKNLSIPMSFTVERNYLIAKLPVTSGGTGDAVLIQLTGITNSVAGKSILTVALGQRNGFWYRKNIDGDAAPGVYIRSYLQTDNTTNIYVTVPASTYYTANVSYYQYGWGATLYEPTTTSTPTGTLNFNSSDNTTYPINDDLFYQDGNFSGTLTAGTFSGSGASLTSIPKGALANSGTLAFNWVDSEVANDLTINSSSKITSSINGASYFRGGDDAELWDINVANTVGVYGVQNAAVGSIKLGSGGGIISGADGNVGIGSVTPDHTFQVNGRAKATSWAVSSIATDLRNNSPWYGLGNSNLTLPNASASSVQLAGYYGINFATAAGDAMVLNQQGNVGIGTTAPGAKLEINSGTTSAVKIRTTGDFEFNMLGSTGGNIQLFSIRNNAANVVHLNTQNSARLALGVSTGTTGSTIAEQMTIISNGNVGIGTTGPNQALHVSKSGWNARFGTTASYHLDVSDNQLQALTSAGAGSPLYLNYSSGGNIYTGSGSVGINTTTTGSNKLRVEGGYISANNSESGSGELRVGAVNGLPGIYSAVASKPMAIRSDTGLRLSGSGDNMASTADIIIDTSGGVGIGGAPGTGLLYVNGNVGIGTTGPTSPLEVNLGGGYSFITKQLTGTGIGDSYDERVVLLIPVSETTTVAYNKIQGKITAWKTGGQVVDFFDIQASSVWNDTWASFTSEGQRTGHKLVTVTYGGVKWLALKFAYTANPYTQLFFNGAYYSSDSNGLKVISYYDTNGAGVLNAEIYNSIADYTAQETRTHNGFTIWDAQNDGIGSGLDADLLDGISSAGFCSSTGSNCPVLANAGGWTDAGTYVRTTTSADVVTIGGTSAPAPGILLEVLGNTSITGTVAATGKITSSVNGASYFRGGDDAELWDVNIANTLGVYGVQDATIGSIKLGSGGGVISGKSSNVGIGSTAPNYKLDVAGAIGMQGGTSTGTFTFDAAVLNDIVTTGTSHLALMPGGNVGIGTTSPTQGKLVAAGDILGHSFYPGNGVIQTSRKFGDDGAYLTATNLKMAGAIDMNGQTISNAYRVYSNGSVFFGQSGGTYGVQDYYNSGIETLSGGTNTLWLTVDNTRLVTVLSNGNVGIGSTAPAYRLELPNVANATGQGRANAWQTYSDARYKTNVLTISDPLQKVLQLRGVNYNWVSGGEYSSGFIAQEVESIIPEIVATDMNGYKSLDYGRFTPYLVEAIKEQQTQITSLKALSTPLRLSDTGDVVLEQTGGTYAVRQVGGSTISNIIGLNKAILAYVEAGLTRTRELVVTQSATINNLATNSLKVGGETIDAMIRRISREETQSLLATSELISPVVTTDSVNTTELNVTGTSALGSLLAEDVTVSGTLVAEKVETPTLIAQTVDATSARIAKLEAGMAELESVRATTAEIVDATISGTLYAANISGLSEQLATSLREPTLLETILGTRTSDPVADPNSVVSPVELAGYNATPSAQFNLALADLQLGEGDVVLTSAALFVDQYFEVNGMAYVADTLGVGNKLYVGDGLEFASGMIAYSPTGVESPVLNIQPSGKGSLNLLAGLMILDESGRVTVNGDVQVAGSLEADTLLSNLIQPADFGNPFQVQVAGIATESGQVKKSRFEIINELGTPVATISAEGKADFAGGIGIGSENKEASASGEIATEKTSGKAVISYGTSELTIWTPALTAESLTYVTPLGSTGNKVLYVKAQYPDDPATLDVNEARFVVGFDTAVTTDLSFNWWIVN